MKTFKHLRLQGFFRKERRKTYYSILIKEENLADKKVLINENRRGEKSSYHI